MIPRAGVLLFILVVAAGAGAQMLEGGGRYVTTSGSAELRVVPDRVEVAVGVETVGPQLAEAKAENDASVAKVIAAAKAHGIDPGRIQTDFISIAPVDRPDPEPTRYAVRRSVVIESHDISSFEPLLSALITAGANRVHSVRFMTSELRRYRDEARKLATKAALEKAELLTAGLGAKVGPVRTISETSDRWYSSYGSWWGGWGGGAYQNVSQNVSVSPETEGALAPGRISVTATVHATFALE